MSDTPGTDTVKALRERLRMWYCRCEDGDIVAQDGTLIQDGSKPCAACEAAALLDRLAAAERERDEASEIVRKWQEAVMEHHPIDRAMDPVNPRRMIANVVRAAEERACSTPTQGGNDGE